MGYRWHVLKVDLKRKRQELVDFLGGVCVKCGTQEKLEFHHNEMCKSWEPRKLSRTQRLKRYRQEAEARKIDLLCGGCHVMEHRQQQEEQEPF